MAKIIILGKSIKLGGTCIAGIDYDTHEWIRPIRKGNLRTLSSRLSMNLLDVIDIQFLSEKPTIKYQRENRFIDLDKNWKLVDTISPNYIERYCEKDDLILHSANAEVDPEVLDLLPFKEWKSLTLIKPEKLFFRNDLYKVKHWRAIFKYNQKEYELKITDLNVCNRLNRGEEISQDCVLTISLTSPWAPENRTNQMKCYKLIAGLIEI